MKTACLSLAISLIAAPLSAEPSVRVERLTGVVEQWQLLDLLPEAAVVRKAGQPKLRVPLADVLAIDFSEAPVDRSQPSIQIELTDGSQLRPRDIEIERQVANMTWSDGASLSLPAQHVRSVRFGESAANDGDEQWREICDSEHQGDTLVLRKKSGALDFLEGVIGDVTKDEVSFSFDETTRKVNRGKLEGFLVYHPREPELWDADATVVDSTGGRWQAHRILGTDDGLAITLSCGRQITLPWASVARIDYGVAKILFVSDLTPVRVSWTPFIQATAAKAASTRLFQPRQDRSLDGGELSLYYPGSKTIKVYSRGLAVLSRTELEYQLPGSFQRLQADVGINARMRRHGAVRLVIFADGRTLLDTPVRGGDEPTRLDLEINGARRIAIVVGFGENFDIADHLNLCNLRVIK